MPVERAAGRPGRAWPAVAARVGLAALGGYALAGLAAAALALTLPMARADAATVAGLLSLPVHAAAALWAFAARRLGAAALGLALPAAALAGLVLALRGG